MNDDFIFYLFWVAIGLVCGMCFSYYMLADNYAIGVCQGQGYEFDHYSNQKDIICGKPLPIIKYDDVSVFNSITKTWINKKGGLNE